jgi:hypothetical protein
VTGFRPPLKVRKSLNAHQLVVKKFSTVLPARPGKI